MCSVSYFFIFTMQRYKHLFNLQNKLIYFFVFFFQTVSTNQKKALFRKSINKANTTPVLYRKKIDRADIQHRPYRFFLIYFTF